MTQPDRDAEDLHARIERLVSDCMHREVTAFAEIASGLGSRRFFRVELTGGDPKSVVARVEMPEDKALRPAGVDPEPALEPLRNFLAQHDIPVPASYGIGSGIQLLEDLGPVSLEDAASRLPQKRRRALYREACELVVRIQKLHAEPTEIPAFGRRLNAPLFRYKAEQVIEWTLPWSLGRAPSADERRGPRRLRVDLQGV